ncbi:MULTISPECIES: outer membrane beta-barrel protein [Vibrio]|uniref:Outer membrane beta-barrel protein n=2 Tax=Vibrio TaxID=662 RepID=A0A7X4LJX2_9VIBR|nr:MULTISPECIES: outer membrane beta-barrel protein [Vibrio]MBF9002547.1 porin family protein [Vibrio nitrifigilis]MZI93299.1 outer membrane beta-barrel protein [Vibrio eleionomae]
MKKLLLTTLMVVVSAPVMADSWIYGGVSAGSSEFRDDNSIAHSFFVGTGIMPWVGLEGGYADFGKFDLGGGKVWTESVYGAIKPNLNFGPLQLYAKVGLNSWVTEGDDDTSYDDDDGLDAMWSVGVDYTFMGPVALGLEYSNYTIGDHDLNTINVTATIYMF